MRRLILALLKKDNLFLPQILPTYSRISSYSLQIGPSKAACRRIADVTTRLVPVLDPLHRRSAAGDDVLFLRHVDERSVRPASAPPLAQLTRKENVSCCSPT
jgi:hypothetical protein